MNKNSNIEWLTLNQPTAVSHNHKTSATRTCPQCNWPINHLDESCTHCHYSLKEKKQLSPEPILATTTLPPIIEHAPPPKNWFIDQPLEDPILYTLRLQAEKLKIHQGFEHLIALDNISIDQYQHQTETALRALNEMRGQVLLADEVGLGKTIEAGIIMKELLQRNLINSILILTPPTLTWQWQEEMENKFHESFTVLEKRKQLPDKKEIPHLETTRWIISLDRAKNKQWSPLLLARKYDLLIIDEAHKLKNHRTKLHQFVNQIGKRYVLMLTATPVHNNLMELYNLVNILRPGYFGTRAAFRQNFLLSPRQQIATTTKEGFTKQITPQNLYALRQLLRQLMIRNRRTTVGIRFPPRRAAIYRVDLSADERLLYEQTTAYIRQKLHTSQNNTTDGATKLTLMTLQKQLCSTPQALASSLEKMVAKNESDPQLPQLLVQAQKIKEVRKITAVQQILEAYPAKTIIFTNYLPSMYALETALTDLGHQTILFHGGLSALERVAAVRTFRDEAKVMISTRSGAEGQNLQFCAQLINFDLPWNPMQIEQRIGRIHRLGQKEEVLIFNLSATNTIEAYILDLLAHKIRMFELVIGELDLVLGDLDDKRSFEQLIEEAWANSYSEEDLQKLLAQLENLLDSSQQITNQMRSTSNELSDLLDTTTELPS